MLPQLERMISQRNGRPCLATLHLQRAPNILQWRVTNHLSPLSSCPLICWTWTEKWQACLWNKVRLSPFIFCQLDRDSIKKPNIIRDFNNESFYLQLLYPRKQSLGGNIGISLSGCLSVHLSVCPVKKFTKKNKKDFFFFKNVGGKGVKSSTADSSSFYCQQLV